MGMNLYYTVKNIASAPCLVFRERTKHFACTKKWTHLLLKYIKFQRYRHIAPLCFEILLSVLCDFSSRHWSHRRPRVLHLPRRPPALPRSNASRVEFGTARDLRYCPLGPSRIVYFCDHIWACKLFDWVGLENLRSPKCEVFQFALSLSPFWKRRGKNYYLVFVRFKLLPSLALDYILNIRTIDVFVQKVIQP